MKVKLRLGAAVICALGIIMPAALVEAATLPFHPSVTLRADGTRTLTGRLSFDDDVGVHRVRIPGSSSTRYRLRIETDTHARGNFDPMLSLFDRRGRFLASDDDGGRGLDARLHRRVRGGQRYYVAILQYDNAPIGSLLEPYSSRGFPTFTASFGCSNGIFCDTACRNRGNEYRIRARLTSSASMSVAALVKVFRCGPWRDGGSGRDLGPRWKTSQGGSRVGLGAVYGERAPTVRAAAVRDKVTARDDNGRC
jgi:hypothetical protein